MVISCELWWDSCSDLRIACINYITCYYVFLERCNRCWFNELATWFLRLINMSSIVWICWWSLINLHCFTVVCKIEKVNWCWCEMEDTVLNSGLCNHSKAGVPSREPNEARDLLGCHSWPTLPQILLTPAPCFSLITSTREVVVFSPMAFLKLKYVYDNLARDTQHVWSPMGNEL